MVNWNPTIGSATTRNLYLPLLYYFIYLFFILNLTIQVGVPKQANLNLHLAFIVITGELDAITHLSLGVLFLK